MSDAPNAAQAEYWNTGAGPTWASLQEKLDRQLAPLGRQAMAALALRAGDRILDIGCGSGDTTLDLARRVSPGGHVTGVDISRTLLHVAERRALGAGDVAFVEGDAQVYPFEPASFDGVFSRFGVMFFADPVAAFVNLSRALKPAGRLAFVCWRAAMENPVLVAPMMAAAQHLPTPPPPPEPGAPGPFAFADADRVRGILQAAGFTDISVAPFELPIGGGGLEDTLELALKIGPLGSMLRENPDKREVVIDAVRTLLAQHQGPDGVKLPSASWIVTARNPGAAT